jgi:hypothetical protein
MFRMVEGAARPVKEHRAGGHARKRRQEQSPESKRQTQETHNPAAAFHEHYERFTIHQQGNAKHRNRAQNNDRSVSTLK